jgi:hypothetical protein
MTPVALPGQQHHRRQHLIPPGEVITPAVRQT